MTHEDARRATAPQPEEIARLAPTPPATALAVARAATSPTEAELARLRARRAAPAPRRVWPVAALVLAAALLIVALWPAPPRFAAPGPVAVSAVAQPLGPDIRVAGAGALQVLEAGAEGTVARLSAGEATFEVDPRGAFRALTVLVGEVSVHVTGTVFTVTMIAPGRAAVSVVRGAVRVEAPGQALTLGAGEAWRQPAPASPAPSPPAPAPTVASPPEQGSPTAAPPVAAAAPGAPPRAPAAPAPDAAAAARAWVAILDAREAGAPPVALRAEVERWLAAWPSSPLAAEAGALRLELLAEESPARALPEIDGWLAAWPAAARRADVLLLKATLLREGGDCAAAVPVYLEVARRDQGPLAREAGAWIAWCDEIREP